MAEESAIAETPSDDGESRLTRAARWVREHKLATIAISTLTTLLMTSVVAVFLFAGSDEELTPSQAVDVAVAAVQRGDFLAADSAAEVLREIESLDRTLPMEQVSSALFALGAIADHRAEQLWGSESEQHRTLSVQYLDGAHDRGFAPHVASEGLYLLGKNLYLTGQVSKSRPVLNEALDANPTRRAELHRWLAAAHLDDAEPNFDEALRHNAAFLDEPDLDREQRDDGLVQRGGILFRQGQFDACREAISQVSDESPAASEVKLLEGRLLIAHAQSLAQPAADDAATDYREAIRVLREAQSLDTLRNQTTPKAMYFLGECYAALGENAAALDQFERLRKRHTKTPEAFMGVFAEAELLRTMKEYERATRLYVAMLSTLEEPNLFSNPWLTLSEFRTQVLAAHQGLMDETQHEYAVELAKGLYPLFPYERMLELRSQTHAAWGAWLSDRASDAPPSQVDELQRDARAQFRMAGRVYARLAQRSKLTRDLPELLWSSADYYLKGHDFENAVKYFNEYLTVEARKRRPVALAGVGEALLAQGDVDGGLDSLHKAIDLFPADPARYTARLLASGAHLERGEFEIAERLLVDNLNDTYLTPESNEWRDSLFQLSQTLYQEARSIDTDRGASAEPVSARQVLAKYEEAIGRLEHVVAKYADTPLAMQSLYTMAEAYWYSAMLVNGLLQEERVEQAQLVYRGQVEHLLDSGLDHYEQLIEALEGKRQHGELSDLERRTLRNAYFMRGSVHYELGRFEAAIEAFEQAANRYPDTPEVLLTYVRKSECYQRLNRRNEALASIEQAKVVLRRLDPDTPLTTTTNYDRTQWEELLDQMTTL